MDGSALELIAFEHEVDQVLPLRAAGLTDFMVDIERRGKVRRQLSADTEVSGASLPAVSRLAKLDNVRVHCRVNSWSARTKDEVREAIDRGAARIYLPMVQDREEVESFLALVDGRAESAILVETEAAVRNASGFSDLPIDAIFVGLNDLAISRGKSNIFLPVVDGTVDKLRRIMPKPSFGFGGATCADLGNPVPARLLVGTMAAIGANFTFLRRSFRRDIVGRNLADEVSGIRKLWSELIGRSAERIRSDHQELAKIVTSLGQ
jgi:hypothetical protein